MADDWTKVANLMNSAPETNIFDMWGDRKVDLVLDYSNIERIVLIITISDNLVFLNRIFTYTTTVAL